MSLFEELKDIADLNLYQISVYLQERTSGFAYQNRIMLTSYKYIEQKDIPTIQVCKVDCHKKNGGGVYYLPWEKDAGLTIELPKVEPSTNIFLTANLTGCFVGFRVDKDVLRICHYNFSDIQAQKGDFDIYTHWVAPNNIIVSLTNIIKQQEVKSLFNKDQIITFYNHRMQKDKPRHTTVFGLFSDEKWNFYLQDHNDEFYIVKNIFL